MIKLVTGFNPDGGLIGQVAEVHIAVIRLILDLPSREENYWLRQFPSGSCSAASYILGHVLLDFGYGDWNFVEGFNNDHYGHSWLEWRDNGRTSSPIITLDATAHQFASHSDPILLLGRSPLKDIFEGRRRDYLVTQLPPEYHSPLYTGPLAEVRRALQTSC